MKFACVLDHAVATIGRDDTDGNILCISNMVLVRKVHRARMKRRDLVVIKISGDEGLRGEAVGNLAYMRLRDLQFIEPRLIGRIIIADRRHDQRLTAEHFQAIGDVPGATAVFAPHVGHQKRHVQDMQLFGQYLLLEAAGKHHDGVVSNRTTNQRMHSLVSPA